MKMRILIADDESHIRLELERVIEQVDEVEIIKKCSTGDEALEEICKLKPDIVFLDISMPGIDGIKLGHFLKQTDINPYIIYLTAYDKYAVEAFKVGAKGYLLKPFMDADIIEELNTAIEYLKKVDSREGDCENSGNVSNHICGKIDDKIIPLESKNILIAYAQDREVYLKSGNKEYLSNFSLTQLKSKLNCSEFFQCHRNFIVNIYKIQEVIPWFNGAYMLLMNDPEKTQVPVSRNKAKELKRILNL